MITLRRPSILGVGLAVALAAAAAVRTGAQAGRDAAALEAETLQHFQALVRIDTSNPPGNEIRAVDYLKQVLDKEGIPYQVFAKDPKRPNLVARIKGNGRKRPILVMGHTDVVTIDPKKWTHPPFSADPRRRLCLRPRHGGRQGQPGRQPDAGAQLKRSNATLDRDVIFLAESGEEGAPEVGAQFMIDKHFDAIDAEYCLAEGGGVVRTGGEVTQANIGTTEKEPRPVELIARGPAGHGSVPSRGNAVTHLSSAVEKIATWTPPLRINETTGAYFRKLATIAPAAAARALSRRAQPGSRRCRNRRQTGCLTTSRNTGRCCTPRWCRPSSARATATTSFRPRPRPRIDVRLHPDEDQSNFLDSCAQ